jgi:hypothetical protein
MNRPAIRLAMMAALLYAGIGRVAPVHAGPILTTPAGLTPGSHFHFVFVTNGTTEVTSSTITDYDNFVNMQAGGATYNGAPVTWQAIGSTSAVDAITHITGPTNDPLYLSTGTEVAANTTTGAGGLWSGVLLNSINVDLLGTISATTPWTGTDPSGVREASGPLGSFGPVAGNTTRITQQWVAYTAFENITPLQIYGLSFDLVVPSAVPEPSTCNGSA